PYSVLNTNRVSQIHGQRPAQVLQHIACRAETRGSLVPSGDNRDAAGPRRNRFWGNEAPIDASIVRLLDD
ncbi:MAG: hypothetical protein WCD54_19440, partial [Pseudolabrys sp.]